MKKIKLLLAALAAMVGLGVQAQTDITSTYLTNADLSTVDNGWTYYSDAYKYQDWRNGNDASHVPAVEFYAGWSSLEHTNFRFSQTVTLPAGDYRIAVNAFYREGNDGNGTNNNKAWIFAGDKKQNVHAMTAADGNTLRDYTSGNDMDDARAMFHDGYFVNAFDFSLETATEISLGFEGVFNSIRSWCILGPVKLYQYSLEDYLGDYDTKYAEAEAISGKMNADVQAALTAAMVDRSTFSTSSQVTAAIATLNTAIINANNSIAYYSSLKSYMDAVDAKTSLFDSYGTTAYNAAAADAKAAYNDGTATDGTAEKAALDAAFKDGVLATKQPGNGMDMTPYITNPDFDGGVTTGWTLVTPLGGNCAIQGGSRMEYWAGNASNRAQASFDIYQEIENLPAGVYTISADMYNSLNSEGGDYTVFSPTCGVYGSSSNEEVALVDVEGEVLNTYTTGEVLYFRGKLRIGTKNTVTPIAARWFLFDNVKLTYARQLTQEEIDANTVPESISLDQTNVSMRTGSTVTLTATILPDNANDKSITWTSSDAAVASVANGVVTALKAGNATITAKANGADDVEATATITVADAPAPAFYTTELVDGDYYIMNAATGQFLGGGNDWGTHASIIEHGIPFGLKVGEGVYTLDSYTYNSADDHFMGGTYIDAKSTNLYINSLGGGKFSISTADGSAFVSAWGGNTYVSNEAENASSTHAQWYFLSKKDRDKTLAAATNENHVDATYYVKQANIGRNLSAGGYNVNAWSQYSVEGTQDNTNFAAQVYNAAVDNYQTIENIPNGTYQVTVQAFTSGTDVKFYANDQKVAVRNNDSGAATCSAAAALFAQGLYPNTVTVTVTDRTLKIGFEGDCSGAKWLCYDKVEMYMTGYTANTGITASINEEEIEAGKTAQITAATDPATASFNAITYSSSDETIATVDANGQVTGLKIGDATITVTANEMENFSTTVNVTVVAVTPTALAIYNGEDEVTAPVALDKDNTEVTLTVVPTPEDANATVTWTSSDETVATVADGVVTAVSTGTATITATSTIDAEVSATATINVSFPETEIAEYTNDGATRNVHNYGANLIKNGTFEYTDGYYAWTDATEGANKLTSSNFSIITDGDNHYLQGKQNQGSTSAGSIGTAWPIENGKTYIFSYRVKNEKKAGNTDYQKLSLTNSLGTETKVVSTTTATSTSWTTVTYEFTNDEDYAYVQFRARWLADDKGSGKISFDDFYLVEKTADDDVIGNVQYALDAIPTANIGTNAFQYSQDAIDNANALVQGVATVEDVENAYNALKTVNAPENGQVFHVILTYAGYQYDNKAITYLANGRADAGLYNIQYKEEANTNLAQAFTFTKVSGNNYKMSQIDADGNARYICTGVPYSGNTSQIRTTTNAEDALVVTVIPTANEGKWNLWNTEANQYIGSQDAGVYTVNSHIDFNIVETSKPSITINTTTAGWGTVMLPFAVDELPEGVKAYTCAEANGALLVLEEVYALEANKPYIIEGAWEAVLTGDAQGTALNYTEGLLTGVYEATVAPVGSYVLQKQEDKVAFYKVVEDNQPTVGANRAYLTAPTSSVKAFFFDEATAIKSVFDGVAAGNIYDMAGRKVSKMQKGGVYVVNGKKVVIK